MRVRRGCPSLENRFGLNAGRSTRSHSSYRVVEKYRKEERLRMVFIDTEKAYDKCRECPRRCLESKGVQMMYIRGDKGHVRWSQDFGGAGVNARLEVWRQAESKGFEGVVTSAMMLHRIALGRLDEVEACLRSIV
ncbi:hypothetical protein H5410_063583 [Solanum commersonii]|uniref:Uncharacterized protein n=1 Tax=Solanum commersonii TaxID=4109 RepID=A0A9J5WDM8_SOLCO|nr:hypothetical protein H5410_063583 [Solanum commersonii]